MLDTSSNKFDQSLKLKMPSKEEKEVVIAEIKANISRNNPNIGVTQTVFLKEGPRTYKVATLFQILKASDQTHHHLELILETYSYNKSKGFFVTIPQEKNRICIDDEENDQIGILNNFISDFYKEILKDPTTYSIIKNELYSIKSNKINSILNKQNIHMILEDADFNKAICQTGGLNLLSNLIDTILKTEEPLVIAKKLQELDLNTIKDINAIFGISQLRKILEIWKNNLHVEKEEFWQRILTEFPLIISQVFSVPTVLFKDKAFVGGKSLNNSGGNLVDYLFRNQLTDNALLIEIKTPSTRLLGSQYRQTYSVSDELSGSINQLLKYKKNFQTHYFHLKEELEENKKINPFNPKTLLIIGSTAELKTIQQKETFDLYRNTLNDIEILGFDELFLKIQTLLEILEIGVT